MVSREIKWRRKLSGQLGTICHNPLERGPFLHLDRGPEKPGASRLKSALSHLLAPGLHFHLPARLYPERRPGCDAGFFSHGA